MAGAKRILVTPRSVTREGHRSLERLRNAGYEVVLGPKGRQPTEDELIALLPGCVGYIAGVEPISRRVLETCTALRAISRNGTGVDGIDVQSANQRSIAVLRAAGANARGVAELTLGLLFALARGLAACDARMKAGKWEREAGRELEGRTLGLVGCGQVGKIVAKLGTAIGLRVLAFDAFPDPNFSGQGDFQYGPMAQVLAGADFVSLHCPPTEDGHAIIGEAEFALMRRGAYLINTARFQLVDQEALLAALESGRLAGAALDVLDAEPPNDSRLARHPLVLATPHIGGLTTESIGRAMDAAVDNVLRELARVA